MAETDMKNRTPRLTVLGSVNLDIVARANRLPVAGETVTGAELSRFPGGKGGNQALAARRLGAEVYLCARVGKDVDADEALAFLRADGVDLSHCIAFNDCPTGVALVIVDAGGENQIVVAPGANRCFAPESLVLPQAEALLCQLEVPMSVIEKAAVQQSTGLFVLNAAPVAPIPPAVLRRVDVLIMNETEAKALEGHLDGFKGLKALTLGAKGAILMKGDDIIARATSPKVQVVDSTGAGDAFSAALTIALMSCVKYQEALDFACKVGALATTRNGAQPGMPYLCDLD